MKTMRIVVTGVGLLLSLLWSGVAAAEKGTIVWGYDEEQPPYSYHDENHKLVGLDIELGTTILTRMGYTVTYRQVPWVRHLVELEEGYGSTISMSTVKTPEREKFVYFSAPYHNIVVMLFVRKGETARYPFKRLTELKGTGFRLGVRHGAVYGDEYAALLKDPLFLSLVEEVTTDDQNHLKLIKGRLDGFLDAYTTFLMIGKRLGTIQQTEPLFTVQKIPLHFVFSKKAFAPDVVEAFNRELAKTQEDGTYQALFEKYQLQPNMIMPEP
jgi:polar amino acid transport system substrate-binding protein